MELTKIANDLEAALPYCHHSNAACAVKEAVCELRKYPQPTTLTVTIDELEKALYMQSQMIVVMGFLCILSGLILSSIAVPLAYILLSIVLMWIGIGIAAYGFGALSHA